MPRLNDDTLEKHDLPTGNFGYSAAALDDLGATEYTLVTIVQDVSSSVSGFKAAMEKCLAEVVKSCKFSPRADNLMIRLVEFNSNAWEAHGFKLLQNCNPDDYLNSLTVGGMTSLFDAAENSISATVDYAKKLKDNDVLVNAVVFIITDGEDNQSKQTKAAVKRALQAALKSESLESILTVLIGVGVKDYPGVKKFLEDFKDEAGLSQYVEIDDATSKTLAKLAAFVSKSISSQSQQLGTGAASQPVPLGF